MRGRVCGVDVAFDAVWYGARLMLEGRGEVPWKQDFTHTEGLFKLAFDEHQPTLMSAATNGGEVYSSRDGGETWSALPSPPGGTQIYALARG